jgi:two-component system KDP operon response regulator KdpE
MSERADRTDDSSPGPLRVLVVDDSERTQDAIVEMLRGDPGVEVVGRASDGEEALRQALTLRPGCICLDLQMPRMDGITLCREIRSRSEVPIIVLSVKGDDQTKVKALDLGADDYVTKPFSMNELLARVRANLRRAPVTEPEQRIPTGDFDIDIDAHTVKVKGREVRLTPKEFDLLVYLARHPGRVVQHRTLLAALWGAENTEQPEYLRVFVGQ